MCDDLDDGDMFVDGPLSKGVEQLLEGSKPSSNPSSPGITGRSRPSVPSLLNVVGRETEIINLDGFGR